MPTELTLLFQDAHCLAVAKPAGLLTQARQTVPIAPSVEDQVRRHLDPSNPARPYLGTVHRLDRPVSGVLLWALNPKAARRLAAQFAGREVEKEYWAIVERAPNPRSGIWDDWLCEEDTGLGVVQVCAPETPRARQAITRYESLDLSDGPLAGSAWLRLWPRTGRTHQLRVQASSRGLFILGDEQYGSAQPFAAGIALHARSLAFLHPTLHHRVQIRAELPESWTRQGFTLPHLD